MGQSKRRIRRTERPVSVLYLTLIILGIMLVIASLPNNLKNFIPKLIPAMTVGDTGDSDVRNEKSQKQKSSKNRRKK